MLWSILFSSLLGQTLCVSYSNHWSSLVPGGIEKAKQVAEDTGCELLYEIIPGEEQKSEWFEIFANVISGDNYSSRFQRIKPNKSSPSLSSYRLGRNPFCQEWS